MIEILNLQTVSSVFNLPSQALHKQKECLGMFNLPSQALHKPPNCSKSMIEILNLQTMTIDE